MPISILCEKIVADIQTGYPDLDGVVARVFATIKYLADCDVFSGYTLKSRERLDIYSFSFAVATGDVVIYNFLDTPRAYGRDGGDSLFYCAR